MSTINLTGLASNIEGEERALAYLEINHNNNIYNWQIFLPKNVENIDQFLESSKNSIIYDIDIKEQAWASLNPKTRTVSDPITGTSTEVEINKNEIVKPTIPDYYALRRNEYPTLADQLDAFWKGSDSQAFIDMQQIIAAVKAKYPKPV
jgi:hypothetical protein